MPPIEELPAERSGYAAPTDLSERRAGMRAAIAAGVWRTDPPPQQLTIGGVRALRFVPQGPARGTILHCHGGAFRIGSPETIAPFAAALATRCGVDVICPAYSLAPEHPFPAGLRDCWSVLGGLGDNSGPVVLSGDSAGGAIATGLAMLSSERSIPISGLALLSPWLDLVADSPSYRHKADSDPQFSQSAAREAAAQYLQGLDSTHPLASPLHGNLSNLPRTHISVGQGEILRDDAERLHEKLQKLRVNSDLLCIENMEHVAVTRDLSLPGAAEAFEVLAGFIDTCFSR
jgi:epsilon-lactone hydrolase